MCAFHFELIISPGINMISYVIPHAGFYAFLLATTLSLLLGHTMTALHRYTVQQHELASLSLKQEDQVSINHQTSAGRSRSTAASLIHHHFRLSFDQKLVEASPSSSSSSIHAPLLSKSERHESSEEPAIYVYEVKMTRRACLLLFISILCCLAIVIMGSYLKTFNFVFEGLTGYLLGPDASIVSYSLLSVGEDFMSSSDSSVSIAALRWMQASYFILAFLCPILCLIMGLGIWYAPLSSRSRGSAMVYLEVVNAWSAMDVFCVAIVATVLQIEQFAQFIIGDRCDAINVYLAEYMDSQLDGHDTCFDVIATVGSDAWILFLAAASLFIISSFTLDALHRAIEEDHQLAYPVLLRKAEEEMVEESISKRQHGYGRWCRIMRQRCDYWLTRRLLAMGFISLASHHPKKIDRATVATSEGVDARKMIVADEEGGEGEATVVLVDSKQDS
jgi:hypothetical protein